MLNYRYILNLTNVLVAVQFSACVMLEHFCSVYRTPGLFGNSGALGIYCVGVMVFYFACFAVNSIMKWREYIIFNAMIFYIILMADSRTAIVAFFIIVTLGITQRMTSLRRYKTYLGLLALCIGIPSSFAAASRLSLRGGVIATNIKGGRMLIFGRFFSQDFGKVIFGGGLGYGTNFSLISGAGGLVADGTLNSLLYQFGIIVGLFVFILIFVFILRLMKGIPFLLKYGLMLGVVIASFNASIFESGGFLCFFAATLQMINRNYSD